METPRETILQEAQCIMYGDRWEAYGHPADTYATAAGIWSAILKTPVTPEQVLLCMVGVKIARETQAHKHDNIVDIAGFAACLDEVHKRAALEQVDE